MFILRKKSIFKKHLCLSNSIIQSAKVFSESYYKHQYSLELEAAVNKQIQAEHQAAHEYLNLGVTFLHPSVCRLGTGGFFMRMYHEELKHMEDLIHYQVHRGGIPIIGALNASDSKGKITVLEAFKHALNMEHCVTELINNLLSTAEKEKDHHCINYVTTVFLKEQINSIHSLSQHVINIARVSEDPDALHQYDKHLQITRPYKFKFPYN